MNEIKLQPKYYASVSGGKDSLYMLNLILHNLDRYPLHGVIHFELEIDYPFIKNVIDYMENECIKYGINFIRIKPRISFWELYNKYGFPTRKARWCNNMYKLDCKKQFNELQNQLGNDVFYYIGYCVDETSRYNKIRLNEIYPLVENNIKESTILDWAKTVDIFNDYYKYNDRCGCMFCPMLTLKELAYMYKFYPNEYEKYIYMMKQHEYNVSIKLGRKFAIRSKNTKYDSFYTDNIVKTKWINKINEIEKSGD